MTTITVNQQNVEILEKAASALQLHLEDLARKTRFYPIECEFAGYRYVFTCRRDIEYVINQLQQQTRAFRSAA